MGTQQPAGTPAKSTDGGLKCIPFSEIEARPLPTLLSCEGDGAVLIRGDMMVLAGDSGIGKSVWCRRLCYDWARGASESGGLSFPAEPFNRKVVYATAYDEPSEIVDYIKRMAKADSATLPDSLYIADLFLKTIFGKGGQDVMPEKLDAWDTLWRGVERVGADLVVIDPVISTIAFDIDLLHETWAFISAVRQEARRLDCGVILVMPRDRTEIGVEDTKGDPYSEFNVAGSTGWISPRGVLSMTWSDEPGVRCGTLSGDRRLAVVKANYGPGHIECRLKPVYESEKSYDILNFAPDGNGWKRGQRPKGAV